MRSIVLEGPDGAGKSYLGERLSRELNMPLVHTGGPARTTEQLYQFIDRFTREGCIFDRHPLISDCIYKTALGLRNLEDPRVLVKLLRRWNPVVVYCRLESIDDMQANIVRTSKAHKPPEYLEKVLANHLRVTQCYDLFFAKLPYLNYAWDTDSYNELLSDIKWCIT
jgi:hypothetical protein